MHVWKFILVVVLLNGGTKNYLNAQEKPGEAVILQRLSEFKKGLDTFIFVKRFESVETPCVCIDEEDHQKAYSKRKIINSDYQVGLHSRHHIDSGVICLSQYYARYARLRVETIDDTTQTMKGTIELTYGYPASSIIQFLGMQQQKGASTNGYFNQFLRNPGRFALYPEKDKYRIWMVLGDGPYHDLDTVYGYLEVAKNAIGPPDIMSYAIYFDQISYEKGDKNNQVLMKFNSTSFRLETEYYSRLLYEQLKFIESDDMIKKANAIWLRSFYNNPGCKSCQFIYKIAEQMVYHTSFSLPNTNPVPAH